MRWGKAPYLAFAVLFPAALAACGGSAGAGGAADDPVKVAQGYADAVKGNPKGGLEFLVTESTEKVTADTTLSRFLGANKGASPKVATVNWIPVGGTVPQPTQKECLIGQPAPSQICIVTIAVTGGKPSPAYFHVIVENRYAAGKWQIINVDMVDKAPDNGLPSGNQAHQGG